MSLTVARRELKNARVYFIPTETSVDSGTVSITAWPDASPTTNWTNWRFQSIENCLDFREENEEKFMEEAEAGGFQETVEKDIRRKGWTVTTSKTNQLIKQLTQGLAIAPVVGTAQAPLAKKDLYLDGVLLIEEQGKDGAILERHQVWARMRLKDVPGIDGNTAKIGIEFQELYAALNTYLLVA